MPSYQKMLGHTNDILPKTANEYNFLGTSCGKLNQPYGSLLTISPSSQLSFCMNSDLNLHLSSEPDSDSMDMSPAPVRKRQRLDHLSQEEKIMRRKLKNRVAAQSARDRKKAKMTELEEQVMELIAEKNFLLGENLELKCKNAELDKQNAELKLRLGLVESSATEEAKEATNNQLVEMKVKVEVEDRSFEHASFIYDPLLKEQDLLQLAVLMMQYVYLPAIARLMIFLICYNNAVKSFFSVISLPLFWKMENQKNMNFHPKMKWWGPHQKSWNPSKN